MAPVNIFVAERGNQFMNEIAGWIAEAAELTGRHVELIDDRLPVVDGSINLVVAPHEFFELFDAPTRRTAAGRGGERVRQHRAAGHVVVPRSPPMPAGAGC